VGLHLFVPGGPLVGALGLLRADASAAFDAGFDLVSFGEHHDGTAGYLPDAWALAATIVADRPAARVGLYPYLVGLRSPGLAREAIEVGAALHPHRFSVALAPGYAAHDFAFSGVTPALAREHCAAVADSLLACGPAGGLRPPCEVLVAGAGRHTVSRAAPRGAGLVLPPRDRAAARDVVTRYRAGGGGGRVVVQRWLHVTDADLSLYGDLSSPWRPRPIACRSAAAFADLLSDTLSIEGVDEVSVRVGGPRDRPSPAGPVIDCFHEGLALWRSHAHETR
jgi:hypothetical protein